MAQTFSREFILKARREVLAPAALELQVVFNDVGGARNVLAAIAFYARGLEARIRLLAAQVVPYPLPLAEPPVQTAFLERNLASLACSQEIATSVELYLCRDRNQTIRQVLQPESIVVIGARRRWWPDAESRLAKLLRNDGHRVILAAHISV